MENKMAARIWLPDKVESRVPIHLTITVHRRGNFDRCTL